VRREKDECRRAECFSLVFVRSRHLSLSPSGGMFLFRGKKNEGSGNLLTKCARKSEEKCGKSGERERERERESERERVKEIERERTRKREKERKRKRERERKRRECKPEESRNVRAQRVETWWR